MAQHNQETFNLYRLSFERKFQKYWFMDVYGHHDKDSKGMLKYVRAILETTNAFLIDPESYSNTTFRGENVLGVYAAIDASSDLYGFTMWVITKDTK